MRHAATWGLLGALAGCGGGAGDTAADVPMITGTIQPEGEDVSGEVAGYRAWAFDDGGVLTVYISSNPDATCDAVVEYLTSTGPYDPSGVLYPGRCNIYMRVTGYEGELHHSWERGQSGIDTVGSATAIGCAMGEGEWVLETRDNDDRDYYWSGRWWQGSPVTYTFDITGTAADGGYVLDMQMTDYDGNFIYEEFATNPASGRVEGVVDADACSDLARVGAYR